MAEVLINHVFNNPQPDDVGPHTYVKPTDWNASEVFGGGGTDGDLVTWNPASSTKASFRTIVAGTGISVSITAGQIQISTTVSGVGGTGTAGKLSKWTGVSSLGDSMVIESATGLTIGGVGPHAWGASTNANVQFLIAGTFSPAGTGRAFEVGSTLSGASGQDEYLVNINGSVVAFGSPSLLAGLRVAPTFSGGTPVDTVGIRVASFTAIGTVASGIKLDAPTGATTNYALWAPTGNVQFDGSIVAAGNAAKTVRTDFQIESNSGRGNFFVQGSADGGTHAGIGRAVKFIAAATTAFPFVISHSAAQPVVFGTSDTERMRIDSAGSWTLSIAGPHAIGGTVVTGTQLTLKGTFSPGVFEVRGLEVAMSLQAASNLDVYGLVLSPTLIESGAGTHPNLAALKVAPSVTGNIANVTDLSGILVNTFVAGSIGTTTNASGIKINAAPTGATNNRSLWVAAGSVEITSAGSHAIGGVINDGVGFYIRGTFASAQSFARALQVDQTLTATGDNGSLVGLYINPVLTERAAGTHPILAGIFVQPTVIAGAAATTLFAGIHVAALVAQSGTSAAASLNIDSEPTGATTNYALRVQSGKTLLVGQTAVGSLGGGDAQFTLAGAWTGTTQTEMMRASTTLTAVVGAGAFGLIFVPTFVEAGSGTHSQLTGIYVAPTFTNGAGATTNIFGINIDMGAVGAIAPTTAAALRIAAPTGATNNYAILVASGLTLLGGDLTITKTAPVLTIEGSGVTSAFEVWRTNGTDRWSVGVASGATDLLFQAGSPGATAFLTLTNAGNIALFAAGSFGSGTLVLFVGNATTAPTTNPTSGGILYSEAGAGKWRGSGGTVTTFGPAEPHCPTCGNDFMHEWENERTGYLAVCMSCLTDEIGARSWIIKRAGRA